MEVATDYSLLNGVIDGDDTMSLNACSMRSILWILLECIKFYHNPITIQEAVALRFKITYALFYTVSLLY